MADTHFPRRVPQPTAAITNKNIKLTWIEGRSPVPEGTYDFWEAVQGASGAVFITIAASPNGSHKTWRDKAYPGQLAIDWTKSRLGIPGDVAIFGKSTCRVEKGAEPGTYRFIVVPRDMQKVRGTGERHRAEDPARAAPVTPAAPSPLIDDSVSSRFQPEDLPDDPVYADTPAAAPLFDSVPTASEANEAWDKLLEAYAAVRALMIEINEYEKKHQAVGRSPPEPDRVPLPEPILTVQLKFCKETRNFYHYVEVDAAGNPVRKNEGQLVRDELYIRKAHTRGGARPAAITILVEPTEG